MALTLPSSFLLPLFSSSSERRSGSGGGASFSAHPNVVSCLSRPRCRRRGLCRGAGRGARGSSSDRGRGRCRCRRGIVIVIGNVFSLLRSLLFAPLDAPVLEQQGTCGCGRSIERERFSCFGPEEEGRRKKEKEKEKEKKGIDDDHEDEHTHLNLFFFSSSLAQQPSPPHLWFAPSRTPSPLSARLLELLHSACLIATDSSPSCSSSSSSSSSASSLSSPLPRLLLQLLRPSSLAALLRHFLESAWELMRPGGPLHPVALRKASGHVALEAALAVVVVFLLSQRRSRPRRRQGGGNVGISGEELTDAEIETLCDEWVPEPLVFSAEDERTASEAHAAAVAAAATHALAVEAAEEAEAAAKALAAAANTGGGPSSPPPPPPPQPSCRRTSSSLPLPLSTAPSSSRGAARGPG